jgi:tol-pal system protein YbgF
MSLRPALAALALVLPLAAQGQATRAELEQRVAQLERLVDNQGLVELARQLDALDAELRSLRGSLEELQNAVERGREQQRAQYLDLDQRLRTVEEGASRLATAATAAATDPVVEYQAAFDLLKAGKYPESRAGFEAFLAAHPGHELAANAQYWIGEVFYVERDYDAALAAFRKVPAAYPQARKVPDALLKAGLCQYELKRFAEARSTFGKVAGEFPDTPAAKDAAARLSRMAAEGR